MATRIPVIRLESNDEPRIRFEEDQWLMGPLNKHDRQRRKTTATGRKRAARPLSRASGSQVSSAAVGLPLTPERRTGKARQSSLDDDRGMAVARREKPILETRAMRARRRSADRHRARPKDRRRAVRARLRRPDREPAHARRQPAVGPALGRRTRAGRHGARQDAQPRRRGLMYLVDTNVVSE